MVSATPPGGTFGLSAAGYKTTGSEKSWHPSHTFPRHVVQQFGLWLATEAEGDHDVEEEV